MADVNGQQNKCSVEFGAEQQRVAEAHSQVSPEAWKLSQIYFYITDMTKALHSSQTDTEVRNLTSLNECWEITHVIEMNANIYKYIKLEMDR